jgi:tRNA 5-methylaminomethyl-2-thiouridine biosynthesis bifunctional protein
MAARGALPSSFMTYMMGDDARAQAGIALTQNALFFPQGSVVTPKAMCAALARGVLQSLATDIVDVHEGNGLALVGRGGAVITHADVVVLANGLDAATLPAASWLPLAARRGQLTLAPPTSASARLRCVLSYGSTVTPVVHGMHAVGATFDWTGDTGPQPVVAADHLRNLADLGTVVPAVFADRTDDAALHGRAAVRCVTPDHLPVVGPLPDRDAYMRDYAGLRHGQHWLRYPPATYRHGLYVLTGLGARGFTEAPLAAELLACHITGEPWPLESDLVDALHPARFLVRALKRQRM